MGVVAADEPSGNSQGPFCGDGASLGGRAGEYPLNKSCKSFGAFGFALAVFGVAIAVAGTIAPVRAAKEEKAFTVANYPVEATDKNAVAAKERALADGQNAAFRSLLKRLVPVTAYKQLARLKSVKAADMVSGFAVRSEQNSSTAYIASLDFSFQPEAVRSVLQREGIPFVHEQAPAVTLIPLSRQGNPAVAKGDTGPWRNAWKSLDLEHTLTPVKLDELKPVIHNDTVAQLASGDDNGMRVLSSEYKTELIILAIAEPDGVSKTMAITLVGQDAVGAINLKRTYRMSDGDVAYASEFAAVIALGVLEGRWKAVKSQTVAAFSPSPAIERPAWTAGSSAGGEQVRFVAEFASLAQWNEIRAQLLDTPGVEDLEIATVSARNADVILRFPGGAAALANSVGARGLALGNAGAGWTLRATY